MATLKEQLRTEEEKLRRAQALLESAKSAAKTQNLATTPAIEKAKKQVAQLSKQVTKLRADVTEANARRREADMSPAEKKAAAERKATETRANLPFQTDDKLWNEVSAMFPNINPETFALGGAGANIFVYQGEKKGKETSPTGGTYTTKVPDVALTNNVVNSFWTDKAIQNKVMNALVASGNSNATQLDAFATWQSVVQQSAQLYNGGKGPKFTPMDVLNMAINKAGGRPDVTVYIDEKKNIELKETLKDKIFPYLQKTPDENDPIFKDLLESIKSVMAKGVRTTTTVDPRTGVKTVKQTGGMTDAEIDARIKKAYQNTDDWLEAKSLEAADYFSQWQRG